MRTELSFLSPWSSVLLALPLVLLSAAPVSAEEGPPTIAVTGTAFTEVLPDEMVWQLRVQNKGPQLEAVAATHHERVGSVLALLKKEGIEEKETRTSRMTFGENRVYRQGTQYKEGYIASTHLTFSSTDLDAYTRMWTLLASFDGVEVNGVSYDLSDRITVQDETRREALRAAQKKAADLAAVLGATLGGPLHIAEQGSGARPLPSYSNKMMAMESEGGATSVAQAPGQITIRMGVEAVFRLVPAEE